jgi:hypothetical protein
MRAPMSVAPAQMVTAQHVSYAGRRDGHPELPALTHDTEIAPARVLPGQAKDEFGDLVVEGIGRGPAAARVGPGPSDELPVPAQQRRRRDEKGRPALAAEQSGQCGEHSAIGRGVPRPCHLAA